MGVTPADFKSAASAISPPPREYTTPIVTPIADAYNSDPAAVVAGRG